MAASVHEFVTTHRGMDRDAAYALLRQDENVKAAIARSPDVEARLAADFQAAWAATQPQLVEVIDDLADFDALEDLEDVAPPLDIPAGARYLCPGCGKRALEPRLAGGLAHVKCPGCAWATSNVLTLVPVHATGALEYVFGPGARRFAWPAAGAIALAGAFLALRWLRL